ncbi:hypothetical protein TWF718_000116 [Orbilia javanica]|uniref:Uncharacterized protein n=1 Tax=Orbilia javanica TaxID=47235 RepID=A0AAN8RFN0_9PEZI
MSIFGAITSFAATSLTAALLDPAKRDAPNTHEQQQQRRQQTNSDRRQISRPKRSILPQKEAAAAAAGLPSALRVIELPSSPSPPLQPIRPKTKIPTSSTTQLVGSKRARLVTMQPAGLPQNSIWTTMSYPIPRGPCLQKSSLISACSCQRFMVHPLKATTSFDCDGCGHHASFHKMKSHEEEVENAAKFRETVLAVEAPSPVGDGEGRSSGGGRKAVGLLRGRVESEEEGVDEDDDDDTVDWDAPASVEPLKKRRTVAAGKKTAAQGTTGARGGKRKRVEEQVIIE